MPRPVKSRQPAVAARIPSQRVFETAVTIAPLSQNCSRQARKLTTIAWCSSQQEALRLPGNYYTTTTDDSGAITFAPLTWGN
jgi:hypothetical protein